MTTVRDLARLQAEQQADAERVVVEGEPLSPYAAECLRHKRGDRQHADLGGRVAANVYKRLAAFLGPI